MTNSVRLTHPRLIPNVSSRGGQLGIVIVNWNSGHHLKACLASLAQCDGIECVSRVVVVDNNSHDDSCQELPAISVPFRLIHNPSNRGFAAACNQGAELCETKYLLFLNPDSQLHANSLQVPLEYLNEERNSDVGICGIQLIDDKGRVSRTCSRLPTCTSLVAMATRFHGLLPRLFPPHAMKEWDHSETREVEQVIGAFFFVRRDLFLHLNGFDERFFVYYEEVDFSERARQIGFRTMFLSTAQAHHTGGGCSSQIRGRALFYSLRSRVLYAKKHFSRIKATTVSIATFVFEPVIRIFQSVIGLRLKNIAPLGQAFTLLWWDRFIASISPGAAVETMPFVKFDAAPKSVTSINENPQPTRAAS